MRCLPRRKIESEYYEGTWRNRRREHRRCRACFTCPTCTPGTKHTLTDFVHGSKICKTCARTLTCVVCKRAKLKMEYPDSVWSHQNKRGHHRCHACFFCPRCPPEEVHTLCDFELGAAICKRCDTLTCSACQKQVEKHLCHRNRDASVTVCESCVELGCTMGDTTLYRCDECCQTLGGQRFHQVQLKHFKYDSRVRDRLTCKTCESQRPQRLAKLKTRVVRSKRRCLCHRHKAPGIHLESCLVSDKESSRRWPGSDEGVTVNDFKLLQRLQPVWWNKALGKATKR